MYEFDSDGREEMAEGGMLPEGWHPMRIDETAYEETKSGNGHFIKLTWEVQDGVAKGRKHWTRLNVDNPNKDAVEIAERELTSICRATGVLRFRDPRELQGKRALVKIVHRTRKDTGDKEAVAAGYRAADATLPDQPAPRASTRSMGAPRAERPLSAVAEDELPF